MSDEPTERAPTPSNPGEQLPFPNWQRYKLIAFLGAGGMGSVYKALDPRLGRLVAVKFLRSSQIESDHTRQRRRFEREARAQASIDHPHICKIYEVGEVEGQPYIAMELIDGASLAKMHASLAQSEKLLLIAQVAEALHAAHGLGLIHRDIKPSNIMVERRSDGQLWSYLMDFGLAREMDAQSSTTTGIVEGTPAFMSPEQAIGGVRRLDHRSDVYSLGATLYLLLTGRLPFAGNSVDVILEILTSDPLAPRKIDPALHVDLETLILKCMEKKPERRYATAQALVEDLRRFLLGGRITARPPGIVQRIDKLARRHKLLLASVGAALVASLVLGGVVLRTRLQASAQARLAHELGQDIKEIELFMREAYGLPLHDIEREQAVVRRLMANLDAKLRNADPASRGALHYAIGRGHLVLREYPQAQASLEIAFRSGYETPEAHLALGLVLGERYRQELEQAQRAGDKKWIETRQRELEKQYLQPALAHLEGARSSVEAPSYLPGLLCFYRRQYAEALAAAERAQSEAPWLAAPLRLEGDVYQVMGIQMLDRGQHRDARVLLSRAATRHRAASEISSSDSALYATEAIDWIRLMETAGDAGEPIDEARRTALAAADSAIVANPRSASGHQLKAWAYWRASFVQMRRGLDSASDLQESLKSSEKAIEKDPSDWQSQYYYSLAIGTQAGNLSELGEETEELHRKSISALKKTLQLNRNFAWAWNDLGLQNVFLLQQKTHHGQFDEALFEETEKCLREALRIDPEYANPYNAMMVLHLVKIDFLVAHGQPVAHEVALVSEVGTSYIKLKADSDGFYYNVAKAKLAEIEQLIDSGNIADNKIIEVESLISKRLKENPKLADYGELYANLLRLRAKNERNAGRNPQPAIEDGLRTIADLEQRNVDSYEVAIVKARIDSLAGRIKGRDARADEVFAQAIAAGQHAVTLAPKLSASHTALCEALRDAAQARCDRGALTSQQAKEAADFIARGLAACAAALAIDATEATALGNSGALYLLRAQQARNGDGEAKHADAVRAAQSINKALATNQFLRRDFVPLLTAAQAMIQTAQR